jgi:protease-4
MTASQRAAFAAWMDRIYEGFVARVAEGRRLPVARVQQIARGRVWTGAQAKALGLVDQVGGFYLAVERAKALGGLSGAVRLEAFGGGGSAWEALQHMLGADARLAGIAADLESEPELRALIGAADDARLRAKGATVLAPSPFR